MPEIAPWPGGKRRIDRVLAPDFLDGVDERNIAEVREMRHEAEQEETDVSYLRRLLQGRIDIVRAELARRKSGGGDLIAELPRILADESTRPSPRGLGRHVAVEPSRADAHRRFVEKLVADVGLSDVTSRTDSELQAALEVLAEHERDLSTKRRALQKVMDDLNAELARRYRDGHADVADLLPS